MMTLYTGLWNSNDFKKYWKNKNFTDRLKNVCLLPEDVLEFSGDDFVVVQIDNVPLEAIIGVRSNNYNGDDDGIDITKLSIEKKILLIKKDKLFLINLYSFKNEVNVSLYKI